MQIALRILGRILTGLILVIMAASVALVLSARRSGDAIPSVLDHKVLTVVSGSMEPTIRTGDVIIVAPIGPGDEIAVGDVITFRSAEKADMLITHRVTGIVSVDGKPAAYVTKGDANETGDLSTVSPSQIIGRYRWRIPYFGYVARFVQTPYGVVLMVIAPGLALIAMEVRKVIMAVMEAEASGKEKRGPVDAESPG